MKRTGTLLSLAVTALVVLSGGVLVALALVSARGGAPEDLGPGLSSTVPPQDTELTPMTVVTVAPVQAEDLEAEASPEDEASPEATSAETADGTTGGANTGGSASSDDYDDDYSGGGSSSDDNDDWGADGDDGGDDD